jgi:hypothetical protein
MINFRKRKLDTYFIYTYFEGNDKQLYLFWLVLKNKF